MNAIVIIRDGPDIKTVHIIDVRCVSKNQVGWGGNYVIETETGFEHRYPFYQILKIELLP